MPANRRASLCASPRIQFRIQVNPPLGVSGQDELPTISPLRYRVRNLHQDRGDRATGGIIPENFPSVPGFPAVRRAGISSLWSEVHHT
jgi:hypothetical protein